MKIQTSSLTVSKIKWKVKLYDIGFRLYRKVKTIACVERIKVTTTTNCRLYNSTNTIYNGKTKMKTTTIIFGHNVTNFDYDDDTLVHIF